MNISRIIPHDIANGPGIRVSLFVSGCRRHCPGCFNPDTWDFHAGVPFTGTTALDVLRLLAPPYIAGLSLLGGDPLEPENRASLAPFLDRVRAAFPHKDIWCWTGFRLEDLAGEGLLDRLDVLVDGPFIEALRAPGLQWRGSSNQRILFLKHKPPEIRKQL